MANNCYYQMKVVADNRETLDRLKDIMDYEDPKYYINRVRSVEMNDVCQEDGKWIATYSGDVAWSAHNWVDDEPDDMPDKEGRFYTTLTALSEELGFSCEIFAEECGNTFCEHFHVHRGEVLTNDSTDWYDCIFERGDEDELEDTMERMIQKEIISKKDAREIRKQAKELFENGYSFTVEFGGYEWDFSNAEYIDNDDPIESYAKCFEVIA